MRWTAGFSAAAAVAMAAELAMTAQAASPTAADGPNCRTARTKIVGGELARIEDWPFQAVLWRAEEQTLLCGGTRIAPEWVLTAAHCVAARDGAITGDADAVADLRLLLGVGDLKAPGAREGVAAAEIVTHPEFVAAMAAARAAAPTTDVALLVEPTTLRAGHDIALVRLATPAPGPTARLSQGPETDPAPDQPVRVAGFGAQVIDDRGDGLNLPYSDDGDGAPDFDAGSDLLKQAQLFTVARPPCVDAYSAAKDGPYAIGDGQLCAADRPGPRPSSACQGDSGGPLVAYDAGGCPTQVGLVSFGVACGQARRPGVYTRVSAYIDWIESVVGPLEGEAAQGDALVMEGADAASPRLVAEFEAQVRAALAGAEGRVALSIDGRTTFRLGEKLRFDVTPAIAGRLILLDVNAEGAITPLYPSKDLPREAPGVLAAGETVRVPRTGQFEAQPPTGEGRVIAILTPVDFDTESLAGLDALRTKGWGAVPNPIATLADLAATIEAAAAEDPSAWGLAIVAYEITE